MALYVDSAHLEDVAGVCARFPVVGVTTNPSILLAAVERGQRLDDLAVARGLLDICTGHVFMQPTAETPDDLLAAARRYIDVDPARVVVKLPMNALGVQAGKALKAEGARVAYTATYTLAQTYIAAMAGADWVIPYHGRLRRAGIDAAARIGGMVELLVKQQSPTHVLAASVKSASCLVEVVMAGAHDATLPPEVIRALSEDALTEAAVAQFATDWQRARAALG
ncbi:MAG TPA: transaldolase family protein [Ktedonobacterales bacterium]|nr:transaldolase family protein [Ktedonobacterales bacterium]